MGSILFDCILGACLVPWSLGAATIRVPADRGSIQDALDAAEAGDTVLVAPGEYVLDAPLDFNRRHQEGVPTTPPLKDISLVSEAGPGTTVLRMGVPREPGRASVVLFRCGETAASRLDGFTLTGGGGMRPNNRETYGGGLSIVGSSPGILRCRIWRNAADCGGGVEVDGGDPYFHDSTIEGNSGMIVGGGLYSHNSAYPRLDRCRILGNHAGSGSGGGIYLTSRGLDLSFTVIAGNFADSGFSGIGINRNGSSRPILDRCTVAANNSRSAPDHIVPQGDSIFWDNDGDTCAVISGFALCGRDPLFVQAPVLNFGQFVTASVGGVDRELPDYFVVPGDYRLLKGSPAIDAGNTAYIDADGTRRDLGGFPFDQARRPNRTFVVDGSGGGDFRSPQEAVLATIHGDDIIVRPGTYDLAESLRFYDREIVFRSEAGPEATILRRFPPPTDPDFGCVIRFDASATGTTVVEGFTITGGYGDLGGGIQAWNCGPTIRRCRVMGNRGNSTSSGFLRGGGICASGPGLIEACEIEGNQVLGADTSIQGLGGGIYAHGGVRVIDCRIAGNQANVGGGAHAGEASFIRCSFAGNMAGTAGGGLAVDSAPLPPAGFPSLDRCAFAGNLATEGGGLSIGTSSPSISGCVVWDNLVGSIAMGASARPVILYSSIEGTVPWPGEGNILAPPLFAAWPREEIWVDPGARPDGDGSPEHPFIDLLRALGCFRLDPARGSPLLAAGPGGANIGPHDGAGIEPGPERARLRLQTGTWVVGRICLALGAGLAGGGSDATVVRGSVLGLRSGSVLEDLSLQGDEGPAIILHEGGGASIRRCSIGTTFDSCRDAIVCGRSSSIHFEDCLLEGSPGAVLAGERVEVRIVKSILRRNGTGSNLSYGGILRLIDSQVAVMGSLLDENGRAGISGDCIRVVGGSLQVEGTEIYRNLLAGIRITEDAEAALKGVRIEENRGLAISVEKSSASISDCTLRRTGGIRGQQAKLEISRSQVLAGSGSGVEAVATDLRIDACTIAGNSAATSGAGIRISGTGPASVTNTVIAGNQAPADGGGGLAVLGAGSRSLVNCTLTENTPALRCDAPLEIRNCIFWKDGAGPCGPPETSLIGVDPLFVREGTYDFERTEIVDILGMEVLFPAFIGDAGDHRLRPGSPAIDAGNSAAAPAADLEGNPRPRGAAVDLGAYEAAVAGEARFLRGDVDGTGSTDITDAILILGSLFLGAGAPECPDSADVDDTGTLDISDPIGLLEFLFLAGPPPVGPTGSCGTDPSADALSCRTSPACGQP